MFGNPCFWPLNPQNRVFDPKTGFLTTKQEIISKFISKLFSQNFCEFEKTGYFQKNSELRKPNYSVTCENKKFGKFRLSQGLTKTGFSDPKVTARNQLLGSDSPIEKHCSKMQTCVKEKWDETITMIKDRLQVSFKVMD